MCEMIFFCDAYNGQTVCCVSLRHIRWRAGGTPRSAAAAAPSKRCGPTCSRVHVPRGCGERGGNNGARDCGKTPPPERASLVLSDRRFCCLPCRSLACLPRRLLPEAPSTTEPSRATACCFSEVSRHARGILTATDLIRLIIELNIFFGPTGCITSFFQGLSKFYNQNKI